MKFIDRKKRFHIDTVVTEESALACIQDVYIFPGVPV